MTFTFDNEQSTSRLEAFSDGAFAVAMAVLVLTIQIPPLTASDSLLLLKLLGLWPELLGYVLSFEIVGIYWVVHHNTFHLIQHADHTLLLLNLLLLVCMLFIPFPTALLGHYPAQQLSIVIYGGTLVLTGLVLQLLWWYATNRFRLVDRRIDPQFVQQITRRNLVAPLIAVLAMGISLLSVQLSFIIFMLAPVPYLFPGRLERRWMQRHAVDRARDVSGGNAGEQESPGGR